TGRAPALIIVNGHGGDKLSWYAFYSGILYARAGAVVLTYDPAGEAERHLDHRHGTRSHDKVEPPDELGRRVGGLMVTDLLQAVSYLSQRPDVDPARIGAAGYSMGSFVLALAGAVETRLKACVLAGGGNLDGPGGYWDTSKPMCQGLPYRALAFLGDRPAVLYALHASRGPTLIYNGTEDTTVAVPRLGAAHLRDVRARAARLRGSEAGLFDTGFEEGAGHRPWFVTRPVALWLERHLDFPRWTAEGIAALPETHIGRWARENFVGMDKLYSSEHREGGTRALGTGIPVPKAEQLAVFTSEQWTRHRDLLIHERWLERARAQLARPQAP
ncbi:MAG: alpha/beta hydrolase family protein, partial [Opitutaceae bacterium]